MRRHGLILRISQEFDVPSLRTPRKQSVRRGATDVPVTRRRRSIQLLSDQNRSAYGDAGLVTTNDPALAEHMRHLRDHRSARRYYHEEFGWNCQLDPIQGAVLRVKMRHIEEWNRSRRERAETYDLLFTKVD